MSLPKRERALCLFNTEILRAKLADAKVVLESEESDDFIEQQEPAPALVAPATPQARKVSQSTILSSPHTPDLSSRGASASASPAPQTPSAPSSNYTVSSLAQMSFAEIYGLVNSGVELPMLKISPEQLKESETWVGTVSAHTLPTFKEQVGRKWLSCLKAAGYKRGIKVVSHYMTQIDEQETRSLAHIVCIYPEIVKQKALQVAAENNIPLS